MQPVTLVNSRESIVSMLTELIILCKLEVELAPRLAAVAICVSIQVTYHVEKGVVLAKPRGPFQQRG